MRRRVVFFVIVIFMAVPAFHPGSSAEEKGKGQKKGETPVFCFPGNVVFWNVPEGIGRTERIFLRQGDDHPLKIKNIMASGRYITAKIEKSGGKEHLTYTIAVTLGPKAPKGAINGKVIIETDHPRAGRITVPVTGNVLDDLRVTPPALSIRLKRATGEGYGVIKVDSSSGKKFKILSANVSSPEIKTDIHQIEGGLGYLILVDASEPDKTKRRARQVLLHISVDAPQGLVVAPVWIQP